MHLVAVYGSLKLDFWNNGLLRNATFVDRGLTDSKFMMMVGGVPFVSFSNDGHRVDVEVYEVDDYQLETLDWLEGHPSFYRREEIRVETQAGSLMCWMYLCSSRGGYRVVPDEKGVLSWNPKVNKETPKGRE